MRVVAEGIREGKSFSEIGAALGVSKQAAHKLAGAVIATLRERLQLMGFGGVDTMGFLKSIGPDRANLPPVADSPPQERTGGTP
jgi:hypothetical protein